MGKGFAFPTNEEIWIPLFNEFPPTMRKDPAANSPAVLGLIKADVSFDQANAEATTIARRFAAAYPDTNKPFNAGKVEPLLNTFTPRPLRGTLWTMLGFCVGVLLIACMNVMNMQFARATLRSKELAVRSSLGATRGRLIRQMLTESLLVAGIGAAVGIALAYGATDWLSATVRNLDNPPPSWITFDVDGKALAFTVFCTLAAAVVSGLLPAWMSSRANAVDVLRDAGRGNTSRAVTLVSRGLVVFQIVVTCILLVGSLLQLRSITRQQSIDYGYDGRSHPARMGLMQGDYPTPESKKAFYDHLQQALAQGSSSNRRADRPVPHGVRRQRPHRNRRAYLSRPRRSAVGELRAGDRQLLLGDGTEAAGGAHVHGRRSRREAARRDRERGVRTKTLRQRERARPAVPHRRA